MQCRHVECWGRAFKAAAAWSADLVAMLEGSREELVAGLARKMAAGQAGRASNSVAARFRDQLRDLIARLDRCAWQSPVAQAPAAASDISARKPAAEPNGRAFFGVLIMCCRAAWRHCVSERCVDEYVSWAETCVPVGAFCAGTVKIAPTALPAFHGKTSECIACNERRTELHFVRCIKPNNAQAAESFDAALVLHQLRCCGVTEIARVARAGFPTRYAHSAFAQRFATLLGHEAPGACSARRHVGW